MTLESQVPPTIIAITFMVEFSQEPSSLFGSTLQGIQPKFYAMGLMYALNQRVSFRTQLATDADEPDGPVFALSNRPTQKTIQVEIDTETYVQSEQVIGARPLGVNRSPYDDDDDNKTKDGESLSDSNDQKYGSHLRLTEPQR